MQHVKSCNLPVFSAHAEVVPELTGRFSLAIGILRARGGSSLDTRAGTNDGLYSPRTRR